MDNYNSQGSVFNFNSKNTVINLQGGKDYNNYMQGLLAYQSTTNFTGNTFITVKGGAGKDYATYGVDVQCDPGNAYDTTVNFSGENTVIDVSGKHEVYTVRPSGVPGTVTFTGKTATLRSTSELGTAAGIFSQYGAHINVQAAMDITAKSTAGEAYGVVLVPNQYAGNAAFSNTLNINASSTKANAFGIYNSTIQATTALEDNGHFSSSSDVYVSAVSSEGDALGLYTDGESARNNLTGNVSINTSSANGNSFGVLAESGAVVSLGSEGSSTSISATGPASTAVALTDHASVSFAGSTVLNADTALADDGTGLVTNRGDLTVAQGTVSDFGGTYRQTSGSTALGSDSGFFGGDVLLEKGTLAVAMTEQTGVTAGADEAMLSLGKSVTVAQGKRLVVGNVAADSTAQVAFGNNSLLVVDGNAANAGAMITGTGDISVDNGSKLYIANARAGEAYTITDGLSTNKDEYWDSANLLAGRLVEAEVNLDGDSIVVNTKAQDAAKVLPGIIPVVALNTMVSNNLNDTESSSMGIRFLSRAVDNVQFMPSDSTATAMVNEVSRAAVTAGVQNTALRLADAGVDQLSHHLSLSFFGKENNIHKDGVDIWATPMYGNTYTHGMAASGAAVRGNYGGVTLGADAKVGEILGGKVRVGAAVNGGGGKSETRGTATSTDNEYNFGGVNLYAGWNLDSLNVMASVGYAMANHDVKMNLPASMGMGQAKADVDTNAFIADLRAEYQINTGVADILPHAGVRYTALNTESHNLKVNGSTLNSVASDTQHIVQFPIGVTVSKDIDVSGWNVKPLADVSVIPAAGEKKNTTKVSYAGIGALDSVNTRIMDSTSWAGTLGVQAEKGNFALGLNYGVQASTHETDQSVSVGISWKF